MFSYFIFCTAPIVKKIKRRNFKKEDWLKNSNYVNIQIKAHGTLKVEKMTNLYVYGINNH